MSIIHPDDAPDVLQQIQTLRSSQFSDMGEFRILTKSGDERWIHNYARPVWDDVRNRVVRIYGAARDITVRKRAEVGLQQRNLELTLLNHVSQAFNATLDLDQVLMVVLEEVYHLLDVDVCSVWLVDPETDELVCRQASGPGCELVRGWRLQPGEGIAGWVFRNGQSLIVPDISVDARHYKEVDRQIGLELRSILSIPLQIKQDTIGVLHVLDTRVDRFNPLELTLVESLAATATIAIENARLFEAEREQREFAEALEAAAAVVNSTLDFEQVLDRILEQVGRVVAGDAFNIMIVEGDHAHMVRWRGYEDTGIEEKISDSIRAIGEYPTLLKMTQSEDPVVIPDTVIDRNWVRPKRGQWLRSYVGAPIRADSVTVGFLNVNSARPNQFGRADAWRLKAFANHAATAIKNAGLYGEVKELHRQTQQDAETKAMLLREVNHRVGNNLAAIVGFLSIERDHIAEADQAAYQSIMNDLTNRVMSLSAVHRMLSATEWAPLLLSELVQQIIDASLQMLPLDRHISVDITPSPVRVTSNQAHNLCLVINELATNTVKYALSERGTAHITVSIWLDGDDIVQLEFQDNGPGFPETVLRLDQHSVGFKLIKNIVHRNLRGELSLRNDPGAVANVRFKVEASLST